jgi:AcrR family transcriptional regulator
VAIARGAPWEARVSTGAMCARIFERHNETIRVRNPNIGVAKLARIIEATLRPGNRRGFHATSLRDLSKASGVSMGALYSYFDSKAALLSMILGEFLPTVTSILLDVSPEVRSDARRHLAWLVDTHVRLSEAMLPWFVFAFMEAKAFPRAERHIAVETEAQTEGIFADVIRRGVKDGVFAVSDADLAATLIKPLLQDWYLKRGKYRNRGTSIEAYVAAVTEMLAMGLGIQERAKTRVPAS